MPLKGEQAAPSKLSEAEYHTRLHLEEQKIFFIYLLSEAQSEMNMQELRHREGPSVNAWNFTKRISHLIIPGEGKIGSKQNWRIEKELFKSLSHVSSSGNEKKFCCTEAERPQQLNIDEFS